MKHLQGHGVVGQDSWTRTWGGVRDNLSDFEALKQVLIHMYSRDADARDNPDPMSPGCYQFFDGHLM